MTRKTVNESRSIENSICSCWTLWNLRSRLTNSRRRISFQSLILTACTKINSLWTTWTCIRASQTISSVIEESSRAVGNTFLDLKYSRVKLDLLWGVNHESCWASSWVYDLIDFLALRSSCRALFAWTSIGKSASRAGRYAGSVV